MRIVLVCSVGVFWFVFFSCLGNHDTRAHSPLSSGAINNVSMQTERISTILSFAEDMSRDGYFYDAAYVLEKTLNKLNRIYSTPEIEGNKKLNTIVDSIKSLLDQVRQSSVSSSSTFEPSFKDKLIKISQQKLEGNIIRSRMSLANLVATDVMRNPQGITPANWVKLLREIIELAAYDVAEKFNLAEVVIQQFPDVNQVKASLKLYIAYMKDKGGGAEDNVLAEYLYRNVVESCVLEYVDSEARPGKCTYITDAVTPYAKEVLLGAALPPVANTKARIVPNRYTAITDYFGENLVLESKSHIESLASLPPKEVFWNGYSLLGKPVVFPGLLSGSFQWSLEKLISEVGSQVVSVSSSTDIVPRQWVEDCRTMPVINGFDCDHAAAGNALFFQNRTTVSNFLDGQPDVGKLRDEYIFGPIANDSSILDALDPAFLESYFPSRRYGTFQTNEKILPLFYVGFAGSGTYFHFHQSALNVLLGGTKKWYLLPPRAYYGPGVCDMRTWLNVYYPSLPIRPLEVVQHTGEALYIPAGWVHAVINLEPSFGVAYTLGIEDLRLRRMYR